MSCSVISTYFPIFTTEAPNKTGGKAAKILHIILTFVDEKRLLHLFGIVSIKLFPRVIAIKGYTEIISNNGIPKIITLTIVNFEFEIHFT